VFKEEALFLTGPAGKLEARVTTQSLVPIVGIFCHPHPLHEGTFNNKVVSTVVKAWYGLGLSTIRFNFRGVGQSEGQYNQGIGETADLKAVIAWAMQKYPNHQLWLGGFSFGSGIAFQAAKSVFAEHLLLVAPPVHHMDFQGIVSLSSLTDCAVIQGGQDEIVSFDSVKQWYDQSVKQHPIQFWQIPTASHFFHGQLIELRDLVVAACPLIQQVD
jgi:alpha/beta superfamily hydrolase